MMQVSRDSDWWYAVGCIACILIFIIFGSMCARELKEKDAEIKRLEDENLELAMGLKQAEDDMFEIALELQLTNETLADTAEKLANANVDMLEYEYMGEYTITAYCCEKYPHICGGGNTASGHAPIPNLTCAVSDLKKYPIGTVLFIEGIGIRVVQDTGGFGSTKMDVAVKTHKEASSWKNTKHKVWIVKER